MKHFICTTQEKRASYCVDVVLTVYLLKKGRPVFIGQTRYNSGACKGNAHEAMDVLLEKKFITKKTFKATGGYYRDNSKFTIDVL